MRAKRTLKTKRTGHPEDYHRADLLIKDILQDFALYVHWFASQSKIPPEKMTFECGVVVYSILFTQPDFRGGSNAGTWRGLNLTRARGLHQRNSNAMWRVNVRKSPTNITSDFVFVLRPTFNNPAWT